MQIKLFSAVFFSLVMIGVIEIFLGWYQSFLKKRKVGMPLVDFLVRICYVILSFLFWRGFIQQWRIEEYTSTHFFFALFIYCFYRLIASFVRWRRQ